MGGYSVSPALILGQGEYITNVFCNVGAFVDQVRLDTNKGQTIIAGKSTGKTQVPLTGVKVVAISGTYGAWMDQLVFWFVPK